MIMRIFQVTIRPGKESEFADFFNNTAIPLMRSTEGIVQVLPGAAREASPREFSFVMVWRDLASLQAFVVTTLTHPISTLQKPNWSKNGQSVITIWSRPDTSGGTTRTAQDAEFRAVGMIQSHRRFSRFQGLTQLKFG